MDGFLSALIGAVIGALVSAAVTYFTLRFNYRQLFAETVSQNRMDWINNFREEFSTVIGYAAARPGMTKGREMRGSGGSNDSAHLILGEKARAKLLTRLNLNVDKYGNEYNAVFEERLKKIDFSKGATRKEIDELIDISRKILEFEWNRVKEEAKGEYQNV